MTPREMIRAHAYPVLAVVSTVSLVIISTSLIPIAKWSRSQNECIERTFKVNGINTQGLSSKVWSCNGGGD
ncbi:hypothetical protein [Prochlorococcus sp. MIT 1341]|uniref:hypothetical protein n=1 Tax=Prochlorococcus sp. MIT 1341 TaxID=3096221 RepID=UPI002A750E6B|nr:hypothetical protein [Prochlorococcus sp. MIT 1341]